MYSSQLQGFGDGTDDNSDDTVGFDIPDVTVDNGATIIPPSTGPSLTTLLNPVLTEVGQLIRPGSAGVSPLYSTTSTALGQSSGLLLGLALLGVALAVSKH